MHEPPGSRRPRQRLTREPLCRQRRIEFFDAFETEHLRIDQWIDHQAAAFGRRLLH